MQQEELPMKDVTPKKASGGRQSKTKKSDLTATDQIAGNMASTGVAVHHPTEPAAPKSVLAIIADAAASGVDATVMRELLDMQKEVVADQRRQEFDSAFIALQAELPVINKDNKIEIRKDGKLLQSTPYASFDAMMDAIQPLLTKHGFGLSFETASAGDRLLVRGHLIGHGHERHTEFPLPAEVSGSKNNVQGWGSSLSYGKRYCTIALLNIRSRALQDADTDGFPGDFQRAKGGALSEAPPKRETLTTAEAKSLRELMDDCGVETPVLCRHFGIDKVAELPREMLQVARKDCEDFRANQSAKKRHG